MNAYNDMTPLAPRLVTITQHFIEASAALLAAKKGTSDIVLPAIDELHRIKVTAEEMRSREEAIAVNPRLSSVGRLEEMKALTKEFAGRFRSVRDGAEARKRAATDLRDRLLSTPNATGNETVDYLRGAEIRQRLAKLPMSDRTKILLSAMAAGNLHVLRAVELDPLAFSETDPLIEPEFLQRIKEERAQKHENGKEWMKLQSLIFVSERLEQLAMAIDLQLSHYNELPSFAGRETRTSDLKFQNTQQVPPKSKADQPPAHVSSFQ
jgi:hypothetical protein